ncbi:hypothetical protein BDN72DRAFT_488631 [Pluteus cervinus]|uniref:Uncharacterized protein n=1 Tax=Pluteus cervinus TaxID=181527 RepID=A0ACD3A5J7_9AGAR|nr:hypothetical protein BDN72DRAFT_488631 [Pluteus cervinus]
MPNDPSHPPGPPSRDLPTKAPDSDPNYHRSEELLDARIEEQDQIASAEGSDHTPQRKSFINALLFEDEDTLELFAQMQVLCKKLAAFVDIEDFYESFTNTIDMLIDVQSEMGHPEAGEDKKDPSPISNEEKATTPDPKAESSEGVDSGEPKAPPRRSARLSTPVVPVKVPLSPQSPLTSSQCVLGLHFHWGQRCADRVLRPSWY